MRRKWTFALITAMLVLAPVVFAQHLKVMPSATHISLPAGGGDGFVMGTISNNSTQYVTLTEALVTFSGEGRAEADVLVFPLKHVITRHLTHLAPRLGLTLAPGETVTFAHEGAHRLGGYLFQVSAQPAKGKLKIEEFKAHLTVKGYITKEPPKTRPDKDEWVELDRLVIHFAPNN